MILRKRAHAPKPRLATLYGKADCPLCEHASEVLAPLISRGRLLVRRIDITDERDLHARYALSIPVLEIDGGPRFDWPFDRASVENALS